MNIKINKIDVFVYVICNFIMLFNYILQEFWDRIIKRLIKLVLCCYFNLLSKCIGLCGIFSMANTELYY